MRRKSCSSAIWCGLLTACAIAACAGRASDLSAVGNDSESHFLVHCVPGGCSEGLSCLFGVCTALCSGDSECSALSSAAVCRSASGAADSSGLEQSICDVACSQAADCLALGPNFGCDDAVCRADDALLTSSFSQACTDDSQCTAGLSCLANSCSQACEVTADCSSAGAVCDFYLADDTGATRGRCLRGCADSFDGSPAEHEACTFLGESGRCSSGACRETFGGQCGDVGQPGAEWACYEDMAAEVFRARHASLLDQELCVPGGGGRVFDVEYARCADTRCADGSSGCPVRGLTLESQPLGEWDQRSSSPTVLVAAQAEARLRAPIPLQFDLLDPVERCEYSVSARFWNIQLFDGYDYLSPFLAPLQSSAPRFSVSEQALESGLWQVTHQLALGHSDSSSLGAIIEDSEADVQLLSGGERCRLIQEHVGVVARMNLTDAVNEAIRSWGDSLDDTLECTHCGQLGCELACRYRSP